MGLGYSGQGLAVRKSRKAFHGVREFIAGVVFVNLPVIVVDLYPVTKYSIHEGGYPTY